MKSDLSFSSRRSSVSEVAERVHRPLGEADAGDREPKLAAVDLDRHRRRTTGGARRAARDGSRCRNRRPTRNRLLGRATEHGLRSEARDRLGGRIPEPNDAARIDQEHAVRNGAEHARGSAALLGLAVEPVTLLGQPDAFERVLNALRDRFEQSDLGLVEALAVQPADADRAPIRRAPERHQHEVANADPEQIVALVLLGLPTGQRTATQVVGYQRESSPRWEAVSADYAAVAVPFCSEHERDLGLERLTKLRRDELPQLALGAGAIDDRDDLRAPRRFDETPQQLVSTFKPRNRTQQRRRHSSDPLSHLAICRSHRVCRHRRGKEDARRTRT
jgi:hypothetical protein